MHCRVQLSLALPHRVDLLAHRKSSHIGGAYLDVLALFNNYGALDANVPQISCTMTLGCWEEFPLDGLQPETWEPSSDPSVVIGPDYVDIRRINVSFRMSHGTLRTRDSDSDSDGGGVDSEFYFGSKVDLDGLHRLLSERLRFA